MRFASATNGRFRLGPAFGFGLTTSSPDPAFGREQSNSTGETFARVATSFTGARPKTEIGGTRSAPGVAGCTHAGSSLRAIPPRTLGTS